MGKVPEFQRSKSLDHLTAVSGVGSSPALATCETSQVLLAGVSGGFPGVLSFRPTYRLIRLDVSEIILKGTLKLKKKIGVRFLAVLGEFHSILSVVVHSRTFWHISRGYDSVIRRMKSLVCVVIDSMCVFSTFALEAKQGRERWKGRSWSYYTSYAFRQL